MTISDTMTEDALERKRHYQIYLHKCREYCNLTEINIDLDLHNITWEKEECDFSKRNFKRINLSNCTFKGAVSFNNSKFESLILNSSVFQEELSAIEMIVKGESEIEKCIFKKGAIFERVKFCSTVSFKESTFSISSIFKDSFFRDTSIFTSCNFNDFTSFDRAYFNKLVNFDKVQFENAAYFQRVQFAGGVKFNDAKFNNISNFYFVQILLTGDFSNSTFMGGCIFNGAQSNSVLVFKNVIFYADAIFRGTLFDSEFESIYINDEKNQSGKWEEFANIRKLSPDEFMDVDFENAVIHKKFDFRNRKIKGKFNFNSVTFKEHAPEFHNVEFSQDTSFNNLHFPQPNGNEVNARAYRTLKLAFNKLQSTREEQQFFKLEMQEECYIESRGIHDTHPPKFIYKIFGFIADYGFNIKRPLLLQFIIFLIFAELYFCISGNKWQINFANTDWGLTLDLIKFNIGGIVPISLSENLFPSIAKLFGNDFRAGVVSILLIVEKLLSFILWFFMALALRNGFKMK